jgi:hypothetical protein
MKCPNCGSDIIEGAHFCDTCGAPTSIAVPEPSISDASIPDSSSSIPPPSPIYEPEPVIQPAEPDPQPVLHYEVVSPPEEKIMGINSSSIGTVSLVLGIVGIVFSCVGCGGILSILGAIAGFLSLKTSSKKTGTIGLILSGLGLIVTLVFVCIYLLFIFRSAMPGNTFNP